MHLEPLPVTDAERIFLAHLLAYRYRDRLARQADARARLVDLSPSEYEFEKYLKIERRISYALAMLEAIAERLDIDLHNPPPWRDDDE